MFIRRLCHPYAQPLSSRILLSSLRSSNIHKNRTRNETTPFITHSTPNVRISRLKINTDIEAAEMGLHRLTASQLPSALKFGWRVSLLLEAFSKLAPLKSRLSICSHFCGQSKPKRERTTPFLEIDIQFREKKRSTNFGASCAPFCALFMESRPPDRYEQQSPGPSQVLLFPLNSHGTAIWPLIK